MKHLRIFDSLEDYNVALYSGDLAHPNVSYIRGGKHIKYFPSPDYDLPLYVEALEELTVSFSVNTIYYSMDNATWISLSAGTETPVVASGEKIFFKASGLTASSTSGIGTFTISGACNVGGNIMSLLKENYANETELTASYQFMNLFLNATTIKDASRLGMPRQKVSAYSFRAAFKGCTSLVNAPELPATTLASYCYGYVWSQHGKSDIYDGMFEGCTSLVNAPALPATTLVTGCYAAMFKGCVNLINAPKLPAKTMAQYCYSAMFANCSNLVNAPALPATTLAVGCYGGYYYNTSLSSSNITRSLRGMFEGCTSLVNAPALPATELVDSCYSRLFYGCTSLVKAPELSAVTLSVYCYNYMFYNCTNLVDVPDLKAMTPASYSCYYMFANCSNLVQAPALPALELTTSYCYSYMFANCTNLKYIKAMFLTGFSSTYLNGWVSKVSASGTFVKNAAATWANSFGASAIPQGWSVKTEEA